MSQSLAQLYVHLIFSTKGRIGLLDDAVRDELHRYFAGVLKGLDSPVLAIGSAMDHVHILFSLSKNQPICKVVEEVKKGSSKWIKTKDERFAGFGWQNGYGAFSVSPSKLEEVKHYIQNQSEHHKHVDFQEEFRQFLKKHHIDFDERYVWD